MSKYIRYTSTVLQITCAVFVMVARDPLNQGSAPVNPLVCETPEEKEIFHAGEVNKLQRKMVDAESLFKIPPNESGYYMWKDRISLI